MESMFIVMECVESDLYLILQEVKDVPDKFTEEHVCTILYNMLCCLNFIHSAGLMHRDIKTNNILTDQNCVTKICDFGSARPCINQQNQLNNDTIDMKEDRKKLASKL